MSCTKNKKQWLFFKWNGDHSFEVITASVFIRYGDNFVVRFKCSLCGCEKEKHFNDWEDMLALGFSNRRIEEIRSGNMWTEKEGDKS